MYKHVNITYNNMAKAQRKLKNCLISAWNHNRKLTSRATGWCKTLGDWPVWLHQKGAKYFAR